MPKRRSNKVITQQTMQERKQHKQEQLDRGVYPSHSAAEAAIKELP